MELQDNIIHSETRCKCFTNYCNIIIARKRSLRRLCFHWCLSVHKGGLSLCLGGSLSWGWSLSRRVSVWGSLCPVGSLSGGVSVQGWRVSVQGVSVQGLCPGESLSRGSLFGGCLSRGVSFMEIPLYGNERAIRILLECILVLKFQLCHT